MNRLGSWLKTGNLRYPTVAVVAVAFLFAGMLITSSFGAYAHTQAAAAPTP